MTLSTQGASAPRLKLVYFVLIKGRNGTQRQLAWEWESIARSVTKSARIYPNTALLPRIKFARLDDAGDIASITGIEAVCTGKSVAEIDALLTAADVKAVIYTTPNHTKEQPRVCVLCCLSREHSMDERKVLVSRLKFILGDGITSKSFEPTVVACFGRIAGSETDYEARVVNASRHLDQAATNEQAANEPAPFDANAGTTGGHEAPRSANGRDADENAAAPVPVDTTTIDGSTNTNVPSTDKLGADVLAGALVSTPSNINNVLALRDATAPNALTAAGVGCYGDLLEPLKARGYFPLPIDYNNPKYKYRKATLEPGWTSIASPPEPTGKKWYMGTGLRSREMGAVDIDIKEEAPSNAVAMVVRKQFDGRGEVLTRVGLAPKQLIPFRWDGKPRRKTVILGAAPDGTKHKVELFGDGGQVVAYSIHPDTGKPYEWRGGRGPLQVPLFELPGVNDVQYEQMVRGIVEALKNAGDTVAVTGDTKSATTPDTDAALTVNATFAVRSEKQCEEFRGVSAMKYIIAHPQGALLSDAEETWWRIGKSLKAASQGAWERRAHELWHEFSRLSPKYDPAECDEKWDKFT